MKNIIKALTYLKEDGQFSDNIKQVALADTAIAELAALKAERDAWKEYAIHQQECGECAFHSGYCPEGTRLMKVALKAETK